MGQWATRTRRGGGISLNFITTALASDNLHENVSYMKNVDATRFTATTFQSNPSTELGTTVAQLAPHAIRITFGGDVTGDTSLTYSGTVPGILRPQTVAVT